MDIRKMKTWSVDLSPGHPSVFRGAVVFAAVSIGTLASGAEVAANAVPPAAGAPKASAPKRAPLFNEGAWPDSQVPEGCPFPQSTEITGILFAGRHAEYGNNGGKSADTWYPTWAEDDRMYTPFAASDYPHLDAFARPGLPPNLRRTCACAKGYVKNAG